MGELTHTDGEGKARMVDVGAKEISERRAVARSLVRLSEKALRAVRDNAVAKGDVLAVARLAGIQAAKRTADLVPLCHPLRLDAVELDLRVEQEAGCISCRAEVRARDRTGVEMEAMTAAAVAALTVYDMVKAVDRSAEVVSVRLEEKSGGKSGSYVRGV
jgi:cyclic pyranopterin phosphate synthase